MISPPFFPTPSPASFTKTCLMGILLCLGVCRPVQAQELPMPHQGGVQMLAALPSSPSQLADRLKAWPTWKNTHYAALVLHRLPGEEEWKEIEGLGLRRLGFLPPLSYFVAFEANGNDLLLQHLTNKKGLYAALDLILPEVRTAPVLLKPGKHEGIQYRGHRMGLHLMLQPGVNASEFMPEVEALGAVEWVASWQGQEGLSLFADKALLQKLSQHPAIQYIEPLSAPGEPEDREARSLHRGHAIDNKIPGGTRFDGTGITIAIADDGLIGPHIDFKGRLTQYITTNSGTHGDMTAGIAAGSGNLDPTKQGAAAGAYLHLYGISGYPHVSGATSNYSSLGTTLTSTSYSEVNGGVYNSSAVTIDNQIQSNTMLLHVFSGGNAGTSDHGYGAGAGWGNITGGYKAAKNVIAVGNLRNTDALESSSSRGPAKDGRIKPDICANGYNQLSTNGNNTYQTGGGTSAASPSVMGTLAQISHGYRSLNNNAVPPTALLKAAILNTAEDLGNPGPDFQFGWGRINALRAMNLLQNNRYLTGTISQNDSVNHSITVPANARQLRVMLYWADRAGVANATKALVNNLDLRVLNSSGTYHWPLILNPAPNTTALTTTAVPGRDTLNNVEQVRIANPAAGTYTVRVVGSGVAQGPQVYWLVWEWHTDEITVTYPMGGESFVPGETEMLRWDATGNTGTFTVQYSANNGQTWTSIASNLGNSVRYTNWTVPSTTGGNYRIRVSSGTVTGESNQKFSVAPLVSGLAFPRICSTELTLSWSAVAGATRYIVHRLGTKFMDSIGTTTGTSLVVTGTNLGTEDWFAVTAVGSDNTWRSRRCNAVSKPLNSLVACTGTNFTVAGTLRYANSAQTPMNNTLVILKQNNVEVARDTTDAQGQFSIANRPIGSYTIEYQTVKSWGGVNATDALGIARHFGNVLLLNGLPLLAADVNASNTVNATDALTVARRFSNVINTLPSGSWLWETTALNLVTGGSYNNLALRCLTYGDVNASYVPPAN